MRRAFAAALLSPLWLLLFVVHCQAGDPLQPPKLRITYSNGVLRANPMPGQGPSGLDQISRAIFDAAHNAIRVNATLAAQAGRTPGNADQVFTSIFDAANNALKVNCVAGCGGGGSGTVTVVSSGSLTSTALVTGGGTTTLQTPSSAATVDSSGNLVATKGTFGTGTGSIVMPAGTLLSAPGNGNFRYSVPATVPAGGLQWIPPATLPVTGNLMSWTTSGSVMTPTDSGVSATGVGHVITGTVTLSTSNISSGACVTTTQAATGVVSTDAITASPNAAWSGLANIAIGSTGGWYVLDVYPTSGNVNVETCNSSSGTVAVPASTVLNFTVVH